MIGDLQMGQPFAMADRGCWQSVGTRHAKTWMSGHIAQERRYGEALWDTAAVLTVTVAVSATDRVLAAATSVILDVTFFEAELDSTSALFEF